ncbi:DUF4832 domain-containing protein [Marinoscillum sp.]|uniref:DUF4832 domain-containing protein n=1 Tax=Marinoscillum sp. TaxID=2024838 RepID=UPI003BABB3FC
MRLLLSLLPMVMLVSCKTGSDVSPPSLDYTLKTYVESSEDFVNPERGFYRYTDTRASNYNDLSLFTLQRYRGETGSSGADYRTYNSLIFRYYILDDFVDGPLDDAFLANMQKDFDVAREAGVKLIPRFTYTTSANDGDCPEGFICPPYGDAPKEIVLNHISQVGPVLSANVDVLFTVQMGFIGTWGENYYTDYFGDASPNADQGKLLDENWQDRIDVLKALLDATPEELQIQVRYPQMKQRAVYGIDAATNVAALTKSEAFDGSDKSRIAFHNDCLFASAADFGTYEDYGNSSSPRRTDVPNLKSYFAEDSKYVIVGGETCSDGYSPQNDCAPAGMADEDLRYLHYTYLNADYNNDVNNDWVEGGCMEAIKRNLGYRIVLDSAYLEEKVAVGGSMDLSLFIRNVGYAAPMSDRPVVLILFNQDTEESFKFEFNTDVRFWLESVSLEDSFDLSNVPAGVYNLYLSLPDGHESIEDRPEYAIRLANEDMWEEESGWNNLDFQVTVE